MTTDSQLMDLLDGVEGWFSGDQVARVATCAAQVPPGGCIVEIGSFRGRSTIAIARSVRDGVDIVAIDPYSGDDRGPQEITGHSEEAVEDYAAFKGNLERAGVADRVRQVRKFSHDAHGDVTGQIDVLHIDGAHRFRPAHDDIHTWGGRVKPGGWMLIHDSFSSIGVTLAILSSLVWSDRWRYEGRDRSLARYRAVRLGGTARVRNALRQLAELPWFGRNVAVKVLLTAKRKDMAQRLGHPASDPWPY